MNEGVGGVGDEGEVLEDMCGGEDDGIVGLLWEFAAEGGFPGCEGGVGAQGGEEGHLLCEDLGAGFGEFVARGVFFVRGRGFKAVYAHGDGGVDN